MKKFKKYFRLFIISLLIFNTSCDELRKIDRSLSRSFRDINRIENRKNYYSKKLGLDKLKTKDKKDSNPNQVDNTTPYNTINQKNMINQYGYMFEIINGVDPGKVIDNESVTGPPKLFSVYDSLNNQIRKDVEVFGWHPYWMKSKWENYPFHLLSTVSYFSYKIDPTTGAAQNPSELSGWTDSEFVKYAKKSKTRVLLTVSLHGEKNINSFFESDYQTKQTLFKNVSELVLSKGADGVDLNFENLPSSKRKEFLEFVKDFKIYLHKEYYKKNLDNASTPFLSITLPASASMQNYSLPELSNLKISKSGDITKDKNKSKDVINLFIIMGYDYQSNQSPGPTSPLQSEKNSPSLLKTMEIFDSFGVSKDRTILALPYYGLMYDIKSVKDSLSGNQMDIKAEIERKLTYKEINDFFINDPNLKYQIDLDLISMSKEISIVFDDNSMKEIFYDDAFTLEKKYAFAMTQGLKGVGIWALGYDDGRYDLWNLIDNSFTTDEKTFTDPVAEINGYPVKFAKSLIKDKNIFVVIIIFLFMSVIISSIILLNDWRVRQKISSSKLNSLIMVSICYVFLIPLIVWLNEFLYADGYGIYIKSELNLYLSMFLGALFYYLGSKITIKKQDKP